MVKSRKAFILVLFLSVIFISLLSTPVSQVEAAIQYTVNKKWIRIWINEDGSVDLQYNITLTYISGSPQGIVTVGMPKEGFRIEYARDASGTDLDYRDVSEGSFYGIDVYLETPIILNKPNIFLVYAVVPAMVSLDEMNPGNVGMLFSSTDFPDAANPIGNIRAAVVLPKGVATNEVKYLASMAFDNVFMDGDNLVVYWERSNWPASREFRIGVSFPAKYVNLGPNWWLYIAFASAGLIIAALGIASVMKFRKATYEKPIIAVEALGAARGLTAVEAAVVLELKPVRVLTMILFGLLLKRIIAVIATEPVLKLQKLELASGETSPGRRYYEIDYSRSIKLDGDLDEVGLARTYLELRDTVDMKLRGYSRSDTVNYYQSVVNKAWDQVMQAGTPELKGDAVDQNIEWLLADDRFDEKFRVAFPPDVIIYPYPGWWWYWRGPHFPSGQAPSPPTKPGEVKPIPGQEFANRIVLGLEKATNNVVKNVQEFANRLVPTRPSMASERSVRSRSGCVCACAACACACACVSCACACAHGGAR